MYGDGLEDLEKAANEILNDLFFHIDNKNGKPWIVNEDLVACFLNIIFSLVSFLDHFTYGIYSDIFTISFKLFLNITIIRRLVKG